MAVEATIVCRLRCEEEEDYIRERVERALEDSDCIVTTVEQEEV